MAYNFLPGVQVTTIDGGLVARRVPTSKAVLVLGTAAQGPANNPYAVSDRATAAQLFGFGGSLIRGMEEVALGGADNIILFRIGTTPATLANVGKSTGSTATAGFTISFGQVDVNVGSEYTIWYNAGILYVYNGSQLVYANDVANSTVVDTGDLTITGIITGNAGAQFGTGGVGSLSGSITIAAAASQVAAGNNVLAVFTAANIGTNLTGRQLYISLAKAFDLLDIYPVDEICAPDVIFDNPNVAFHISGDTVNNPTQNPNALDWLKISIDAFGNKTYQWASDNVDSGGNVVTPMSAGTPSARLALNFGEVNFAHLMATFAQKQEAIGQAGTCLVFMGTSQPASYRLIDLRTWVGYLPVWNPNVLDQVGDADIQVTTDGSGLLGNPYLTGCTAARLNTLCIDYASGRTSGIFLTDNGTYDGDIQIDKNGNPIDIGAYIHIVADVAIMANGFKNGYASGLSNYTAGYAAGMDEKVNLTNKPVKASQLWKPNSIQLDSATQIGVNFLRFKGNGNLPVFTHGQTAASNASDYKNLLRQRIKGLVVDTLRTTADPFIGASSIDGLQIQSMQTALTNKMMTLQKRGYIASFSFTVTTTPAQQRIGHANIDIVFNPADELIQLDASVALSRT
jgi:hypothetical protein